MKALLLLPLGALTLLVPSPAACETPSCGKLSAPHKKRAETLFAAQHLYACCDETIAECLREKPPCRLAHRLAENICRRIAAGQGDKGIVRALTARANSVLQPKPAKIDLVGVPAVGSVGAKLAVTVYACGRCPFCAKIVPRLYREISAGRLKGKVRLTFKPFPIRGHAGAKEIGLAFVAAAELGKAWTYLLRAYAGFDRFSVPQLEVWARAIGLDAGKFKARMRAPSTRKRLIAAKKEGLKNEVKATPTFFIDGKRYVGEMSAAELLDVFEEVWERKSGLTHLGGTKHP